MNRQLPAPVVVITLIGVVVLAMWVVGRATPTVGTGAAVGGPAPAVTGETASGGTFRLSDQQGKVVLINFWATWCGPCRMEMPELIALQKRYAARGFTVVGLSIDEQGMSVVRPFVKQAGLNYPVLLCPEGVQAAFGGVEAIPASFLIDRDGNVVDATVGLVKQEDIAPQIEKLL